MYYKNPSYRAAYAFIVIILVLTSVLCILPLIHIFSVSLSGKAPANANLVTLWPLQFTFENYVKSLANPNFYQAFGVSVGRAVVGTLLGMFVTLLTAYPLSKEKRNFRPRNTYTWFFLFIMVFSGGLVPFYIVVQKVGLIDSFWVYIIPGLLNVWNVILLMNFFRNLPKELEESAFVDGAHYFNILFQIFLQLSMPAIATLSLFSMVGHWNDWFSGMLFINTQDKWPLATLLQTIVVTVDLTKTGISAEEMAELSNRGVKAAQIFITMLPILMVYPFLQKFFVKGIVLGAVKE
jgi:putative aldouronate transport system permease protein